MRLNFEMMRKQTTDIINIQLKKEDRLNPQQVWPAPWDDKPEDMLSETEIIENNLKLINALDKYTTDKNG